MANPKAKKPRREFSTEYKRRIVDEIDGCHDRSERSALFAREGVNHAQVSSWRRQLIFGTEATPAGVAIAKKAMRGLKQAPAAKRRSPRGTGTWVSVPTTFEGQGSAADLERDIARWRRMIELAEQIIEGQRALREIEAELGAP